MGTALHSYVNTTSCVCSCKEEHTKGNTHAEFTTPVEQVHQPGQADQSTTPNSRDQLRLLFQRQNTPREHTRRVYYTRAGPSTRARRSISRPELTRPAAQSITPVEQGHQPGQGVQSAFPNSRDQLRLLLANEKYTKGDALGEEYTQRRLHIGRNVHGWEYTQRATRGGR